MRAKLHQRGLKPQPNLANGAWQQESKMKFRLQFFKFKKVYNLIGGVTSTVSGVTSKHC